jgi:hypothetical protein
MNQKGRKLQPKLHLDMGFGEALARFTQTDPAELNEAQLMCDDTHLVCLPRISSTDFEAFRRVMKDEIGTAYEKWLQMNGKRLSYWRERSMVIEVDVNPNEFAAFCHRESKRPDLSSLDYFAIHLNKTKG